MLSLCSTASRCTFAPSLDRESPRLNSSHTDIYTLSLHAALPIYLQAVALARRAFLDGVQEDDAVLVFDGVEVHVRAFLRSGEPTSELQSHRYLHSFPPRRSSDLPAGRSSGSPGLPRRRAGRRCCPCVRRRRGARSRLP